MQVQYKIPQNPILIIKAVYCYSGESMKQEKHVREARAQAPGFYIGLGRVMTSIEVPFYSLQGLGIQGLGVQGLQSRVCYTIVQYYTVSIMISSYIPDCHIMVHYIVACYITCSMLYDSMLFYILYHIKPYFTHHIIWYYIILLF